MAKFAFIIIMLSIIGCTIKPKKSVPEDYVAGQKYFHQVCANCHGVDAAGGNKAPTLLQEKFLPTNFINGKIAKTILNGSSSGAMPSQKNKVNDEQIREIIKYIRFSQREAGIHSP
jgi:cytochrome c oxidase cbb3-type subunit III